MSFLSKKPYLILSVFAMGLLAPCFSFAESFIDLPKGCYGKQSYPCTLTVEKGFLSLMRSESVVHLSKEGVLAFFAPDQMQLLKGQIWIQGAKHVTLKMSSVLKLEVDGDWLVSFVGHSNQVNILNLNGQAKFVSQSVFENESIPVGFENWYSGIATNGQVLRGIIRPIENESFLKNWMPISGMSLAASKHKFKNYKENWQGVIEESANFYQQVVARRVASAEAAQDRKDARARLLQQEQAKFRKMFRQKLGLENSQGI